MIGQLREHGVPVVRWAGAGSLDQVLRDVARLATAPDGSVSAMSDVRLRSRERGGSGEREVARPRCGPPGQPARAAAGPRPAIFRHALLRRRSLLAYPAEVLRRAGRCWPCRLVGACCRRSAPRRVWPTFAALVTVGGWLLATDGYGRPIALWRLLAWPRCSTWRTPSARWPRVLPYDAVVDPELIAAVAAAGRRRWCSAGAVLGVAAGAARRGRRRTPGRPGGRRVLGLLVAVAAGRVAGLAAAPQVNAAVSGDVAQVTGVVLRHRRGSRAGLAEPPGER